jgi:hypothetical protein
MASSEGAMSSGLAGGVLEHAHRLLALAPLSCIVVLTVSFLAACGSMNVQVDVIDPAYVETVAQRAQLQSQLREALRPAEEKEATYRRIRADLQTKLREEVRSYRAEGSAIADETARALELAIPEVLGEFDQLVNNLKAQDEQIRQTVGGQPAAGGVDVTSPQLSGLLLQRQATAEAVVENVLRLLDEIAERQGPTRLVDPTRAAAIGSPTPQMQADLKTITGGFTLAESAHAYAIASAPEERWAPEFNRTFGRGTFGNLNFAVKMVGLADFTIKGVTFDPSKVAEVASKVTTQSLLLAAQIVGVPVTGLTLSQDDPGRALAERSAELATTLESNQRFAAQEQLRQDAITAILTRIGEEANNLSGDEAQQNEARSAILATYNAYKDLLQYTNQ